MLLFLHYYFYPFLATVHKEDSDLLFQACCSSDYSRKELEKIANLNQEDDLAFLVNRTVGNHSAAADGKIIFHTFFSKISLVLKKNDEIVPNPNDLITLEKEGIDVSFLKAFDPNIDVADSAEVAECLAQLAVLLPQLAKLQDERLIAPNRTSELAPQLDADELRTAGQVQRGLITALKKLEPGVAYDTESLRRAIGVKSN